MPSFDVVSEINLHEVANAVDQANREVDTRFDFKGAKARFELSESAIMMTTETEFQLQQMLDILHAKLAKRGVDIAALKAEPPQIAGRQAKQTISLIQGIDTVLAKKIVKLIKDGKLKVQAAIQGDQVRVSGKKRDDLQDCIASLRAAQFEQPMQFTNFRD
ncbi:YajQ family cyclic di-GMP-binding protein [Methylococcus sp. EFPC2]|uniref:YajQ family cyclic di-GMP-binding protein n=1 Tax=Methylococcus sp. EFPC2 TaxID=2812648 RepID=UPI00196890E7|nr:YajQ family cyclic di-GMP-binding protein [Methylococcus sp. EFPC2]QSA96828.1 YajQ family cyclic di-GMP-binding protein [Methylococcus sp. EFPC2]